MAQTKFSGPVKSDNGFIGNVTGNLTGSVVGFKLQDATAANLGAAANAVNTTGKYIGKMVVDYASGLIYTAVGAAAGDDWLASDGTTTISPA